MPVVTLNGKTYHVKGNIIRRSQQPEAEAFRTIGLQRRENIITSSSLVFPGGGLRGFGIQRVRDINNLHELARFWDSTLETRFGQITLALLDQDATDASAAAGTVGAMKMGLEHAGHLFGFWTTTNAGNEDLYSFTYGSGSWDNNEKKIEEGTVPSSILDAVAHKTRRFVLYANSDDIRLYSSETTTATTDWTVRGNPGTTANWPNNQLADAVTGDEQIDAGLLLSFGNTLLCFYWDEDNGTIACVESADNGGTWAASLTTNLSSANGPTGVEAFYGLDGLPAPVVGTAEGVYALDFTNNVLNLIAPLPTNTNNCRRMKVWNGDLYVPTGDGGMVRVRHLGSGAFQIRPCGPNKDDGLPSDTQGRVTYMFPSDRWLFAAYSGNSASTKARILAFDGGVEDDEGIHGGWHHIYKHGTANREINWFAISGVGGTTILHASVRTGTNTSDMRYFEKPLTNPKSEALKCELSGTITRPSIDGGFPDINAAWLRVSVDADDLSAADTGEYITIKYGLNGAAADTTTLGNILSGQKYQNFGSGLGVSGINITLQEVYTRDAGDNTQTPKGRSTAITYLKRPDELEAWSFDIDLLETANNGGATRGVETIIAELEALRPPTQIVLVAFAYEGVTGKNVIVEPLVWAEQVDEPESTRRYGWRTGMVTVTVREVLA